MLQGGGLAGGEGIHRDSEASVKAEGYPSPGYTLTLRAGHLKLRGVVLIISFCSEPSILHQSSSDYLNLLTIQHPFSPPVQDLSLAPGLAGNSPPYDLRHVACMPNVHHKSGRRIFAYTYIFKLLVFQLPLVSLATDSSLKIPHEHCQASREVLKLLLLPLQILHLCVDLQKYLLHLLVDPHLLLIHLFLQSSDHHL